MADYLYLLLRKRKYNKQLCSPADHQYYIHQRKRVWPQFKDFWRYYLGKQWRVCWTRPPCSISAPSSLLELLERGRGPYSPPAWELVLSLQEGGPATEGKNYPKSPNTSPHSWLEVQRQWLKSKLKPVCNNSPDHSVSLPRPIQTDRERQKGKKKKKERETKWEERLNEERKMELQVNECRLKSNSDKIITQRSQKHLKNVFYFLQRMNL